MDRVCTPASCSSLAPSAPPAAARSGHRQALPSRRPAAAAPRGRRRGDAAVCSSVSMGQEEEIVAGIEVGTKVRVKKDVVVYHAPKVKELNLMGREGTVLDIVKRYKGKELSANLPYKVSFELNPEDPKPKKFFAHLSGIELDMI